MWKEKFLDLHFPHNPENMKIEEAQKIKFEHIPEKLYRYRPLNEYTFDNLQNEQEWQSYPCEFNDPYDSRIKIDYEKVKKEYFYENMTKGIKNLIPKRILSVTKQEIENICSSTNSFNSLLKKILKLDPKYKGEENKVTEVLLEILDEEIKEAFSPFIETFQNGYLIVCFSETKDNIKMWSHYAEGHSGICIEYNFKELGPNTSQTRILYPVIYTDEIFDATQYLIDPIKKGHRYNNLFGIYPSISKSNEWEYEREWRTIFPLGPGAEKENRFLRVPTPKRIYVGYNANEKDIEKLKKLSLTKNIPLYQMSLCEDKHKLNYELMSSPNK